jgi:hypothetical protein
VCEPVVGLSVCPVWSVCIRMLGLVVGSRTLSVCLSVRLPVRPSFCVVVRDLLEPSVCLCVHLSKMSRRALRRPIVNETNTIDFVVFYCMQNRTFGPYSVAMHGILVLVKHQQSVLGALGHHH